MAIQRNQPTPDNGRAELVKKWLSKIERVKKRFDPEFVRMRRNMKVTRGSQWPNDDKLDGAYVANLCHRQIKRGTAAVYAKNPTVAARRRKRMDNTVWDGSPQSLLQAQQTLQTIDAAVQVSQRMGAGDPAMPPSPPEMFAQAAQAQAIVSDAQQVAQTQLLYQRMGETLEIVFDYTLNEPRPSFKRQAKQLIRRVRTCGVGYIKIGYQRLLTRGPDIDARITDITDRLATMEQITDDIASGEAQTDGSEAEQLKLMLQDLYAQPEQVSREGLIFDFPKATAIIIDDNCTQLNGFVGAHWIAQEMIFSTDEVKKIYKVDVGASFTEHTKEGSPFGVSTGGEKTESFCRVYEVYDLDSQLMLVVCVGYPDFLREPGTPDIWTEQFHPFLALTFNDIEDEGSIYPPSDIDLMLPMQLEYNRGREGLRQHRYGNRPATVGAKGLLSANDKDKLATHAIHEHIELEAIPATSDVDIRTKIQAKPVNQIDPAVYEIDHVFTDIQRVLGEQEANFGGTSGSTATESSISEQSRVTGVTSEVDDLDDFLSDFARISGQVLMLNMSKETVVEIVGPGAVWPELSRQKVAQECYLEVRAGSSGRPNRAMNLANLERVLPYLLQIPGITPTWLGEKILRDVDDDIDLGDAIAEGLPSITMMNQQAQPGTGDSGSDPNQQGSKGGKNEPKPQERQAGPQPDMGRSMPTGGAPPPLNG